VIYYSKEIKVDGEQLMPPMRNVAILVYTYALLLIATGCSRHLTTANICGNYSVAGSWGKSNLNLHGDGTFVQDVAMLSGPIHHLQGNWSMLDNKTNQYTRTIYFKPFLNMWSNQMGSEVPNASFAIESIGIHGVWILVDADKGTTYKRQRCEVKRHCGWITA
jgi:hypothetical protein